MQFRDMPHCRFWCSFSLTAIPCVIILGCLVSVNGARRLIKSVISNQDGRSSRSGGYPPGGYIDIVDNTLLVGGARDGKGQFQDLLIDATSIHVLQKEILMPVIHRALADKLDFSNVTAQQLQTLWREVNSTYQTFRNDVRQRCYSASGEEGILGCVEHFTQQAQQYNDSWVNSDVDSMENPRGGMWTPKAIRETSSKMKAENDDPVTFSAYLHSIQPYLTIVKWLQRMLLRHQAYEAVTHVMKTDAFMNKSRKDGVYKVPLAVWLQRATGDCRLHGSIGAVLLQQLQNIGIIADVKAIYGKRRNDPDGDSHMFDLYRPSGGDGGKHIFSFDGYFYPYDAYELPTSEAVKMDVFKLKEWGPTNNFATVRAEGVLLLETLRPELQPAKNMYAMMLAMDNLTDAPHSDLHRYVPNDSRDFVIEHSNATFKDDFKDYPTVDRQIAVLDRGI